jgi:hypothetical protein
MNRWFDHESSSSLAVALLIPAALMPRFDRVHNSPPRDFRALVEDLRATQSGESAGSWHSLRKPAGSRGSAGESAQRRVNLPQAPHVALRVPSAMQVITARSRYPGEHASIIPRYDTANPRTY